MSVQPLFTAKNLAVSFSSLFTVNFRYMRMKNARCRFLIHSFRQVSLQIHFESFCVVSKKNNNAKKKKTEAIKFFPGPRSSDTSDSHFQQSIKSQKRLIKCPWDFYYLTLYHLSKVDNSPIKIT